MFAAVPRSSPFPAREQRVTRLKVGLIWTAQHRVFLMAVKAARQTHFSLSQLQNKERKAFGMHAHMRMHQYVEQDGVSPHIANSSLSSILLIGDHMSLGFIFFLTHTDFYELTASSAISSGAQTYFHVHVRFLASSRMPFMRPVTPALCTQAHTNQLCYNSMVMCFL